LKPNVPAVIVVFKPPSALPLKNITFIAATATRCGVWDDLDRTAGARQSGRHASFVVSVSALEGGTNAVNDCQTRKPDTTTRFVLAGPRRLRRSGPKC
jgi:hypothetical protein